MSSSSGPVAGTARVVFTPDTSAIADGVAKQLQPSLEKIHTMLGQIDQDFVKAGNDSKVMGAGATEAAKKVEGLGNSVKEVGNESTKAKTKIQETTDSAGKGFGGLGKIIAGSAIGAGIAGTITSGVSEGISQFKEMGESWEHTQNQIRIQTGLTGPALDAYTKKFSEVFSHVPESADQVQTALNLVRTRLGQSGDAAADSAKSLLDYSRIAGVDANTAVGSLSTAFVDFKIKTDDQNKSMDQLLRVSQNTGTPLKDLTAALKFVGPVGAAAGLSFQQTAGFIGDLGKTGIPARASVASLTTIIKQAGKDGISASAELKKAFDEIKNAKSPTEASTIAMKEFGRRAGPALVPLIQQGKVSMEQLTAAAQQGSATVAGTAEQTLTFSDALKEVKNTITAQLGPALTPLLETLKNLLLELGPSIGKLAAQLAEGLGPIIKVLGPGVKAVFEIIGTALKGVAPILAIVAKTVSELVVDFAPLIEMVQKFSGQILAVLAPVLDKIVGALSKGLLQVLKALEPAIEPLGEALVKIAEAGAQLLIAFIPLIPIIADLATMLIKDIGVPTITLLAGAIANLAVIFVKLVTPLLQNKVVLGALVGILVAATSPFSLVATAIGAVVLGAIELYQHFQPLHNIVKAVVDAVSGFAKTVKDWLTQGDHWKTVLEAVAAVLLPIPALFVALYEKFKPFRDLINDIGHLFGDLFTGKFGKLLDDLKKLGGQIGTFLTEGLKSLGGLLLKAFGAAWDFVKAHWTDALKGLFDLFVKLPVELLAKLVPLGLKLAEAFGKAFLWVVAHAAEWSAQLLLWFANLPATLLGLLVNLGLDMVDMLIRAIAFVVINGPKILLGLFNWFGGIATSLAEKLADLGIDLVNAIIAAFDWVVANGPRILGNVLGWIKNFPGDVVEGIKILGPMLFDVFKGAFDWVVSNGPKLLEGFLGFMGSIPGRIVDAIGAAVTGGFDIARGLVKAFFDLINSKLIDPIRNHDFPFIGKVFGFIPELKFEQGGVVPGRGPQLAMVHGGEGVLPAGVMAKLGQQGFNAILNGAAAAVSSGTPRPGVGGGGAGVTIGTLHVQVSVGAGAHVTAEGAEALAGHIVDKAAGVVSTKTMIASTVKNA